MLLAPPVCNAAVLRLFRHLGLQRRRMPCICLIRHGTSCSQLPELRSCQGWCVMEGSNGCQLPFCETAAPQNPHCRRQSEHNGCGRLLAKCPHPDQEQPLLRSRPPLTPLCMEERTASQRPELCTPPFDSLLQWIRAAFCT